MSKHTAEVLQNLAWIAFFVLIMAVGWCEENHITPLQIIQAFHTPTVQTK